MKGMIGAQRGCARVGRGERKEATSAGRPATLHLIVAPLASRRAPLLPLASRRAPLLPRTPLAARPSRLAATPCTLYGRSVAAPYVAARLAPLPRAHRLVGATPFQTAGAGHLRRGYACDDGRRRAGAESGHPGAAMTNCLARIRILRGDTSEPRVLR